MQLPTKEAFSAQVDRAITDMPDLIRDRINACYADHQEPILRDHLLDWIFYEGWRWGDGWITDERNGRPLDIFHDPLTQSVRAAVVARLTEA